jgi:hypothetical protein
LRWALGDILYSVRQIVALYRVQHDTWQWHSIKFLKRCEEIDSSVDFYHFYEYYEKLPDAELVEKVIDMLCKAIKYKLGYEGYFRPTKRDGMKWDKDVFETFRYKQTHKKIAYEEEHAIVLHLEQFRTGVDGELRSESVLSKEEYIEREKSLDTQTIPEELVL